MTLEQFSQERGLLLECPVWDAKLRRLICLDFMDPHVLVVDAENGATIKMRLPIRSPLGGLCNRADGGFLIFNPEGAHAMSQTLEVESSPMVPHQSFSTAPPNDVAVSPTGDVLVATADSFEQMPSGALYVLSDMCTWTCLYQGLTVGNGPAIAPDGKTMYLADSPSGVIYAFDLKTDPLALGNKRIFATVPAQHGYPDGLAVDAQGCIWNARWGGSCVVRYSGDGIEIARVAIPTRFVTSCAFGGDDLSTLFITTARDSAIDHTDSERAGGQLFSLKVKVPGFTLPAARL
jgi:D-xylonolactonase